MRRGAETWRRKASRRAPWGIEKRTIDTYPQVPWRLEINVIIFMVFASITEALCLKGMFHLVAVGAFKLRHYVDARRETGDLLHVRATHMFILILVIIHLPPR